MIRRRFLVICTVLLVYLSVVLAACTKADCASDTGCPAGQQCKDGSCIPAPVECKSTADCSGAMLACIGGRCVADPGRCQSDDDCVLGNYCKSGKCSVIPTPPFTPKTVYGAPSCNMTFVNAAGREGEFLLRTFVSNDASPPVSLPPSKALLPPYSLSNKSFKVVPGSVKILDSKGNPMPELGVTLSVNTLEPLKIHNNARFDSFRSVQREKRVPQAIGQLIDMSNLSAEEDPSMSRLASSSAWVLGSFPSDVSLGPLDIYSLMWMRSGKISKEDVALFALSGVEQYVGEDGRRRGFVRMATDTKSKVAELLKGMTNRGANGKPPLFDAIAAAAADLRALSWKGQEQQYAPSLIVTTLSRDANQKDRSQSAQYENALKVLSAKKAIPLMPILYPLPTSGSNVLDLDWDFFKVDLCKLTQAGGVGGNAPQGQLFPLAPAAAQPFAISHRDALNAAYHAAKGGLELTLKYTISGPAKSLSRLIIQFRLTVTMGGKTSPANGPLLHMTIQI